MCIRDRIYVDATVLAEPDAVAHTAWEEFPTRQTELVVEVQERRQKMWGAVEGDQTDRSS